MGMLYCYVFVSLCRCGLALFYRHSNTDERFMFIFDKAIIKSGEKPITTEKPKVLDETRPRRKRKVSYQVVIICTV